MTVQDFLLVKQNPLIAAVIALIISAFVQYFFQVRLKSREVQTTETLKRLEAELKKQGDRTNGQFQTLFSSSHKVREEVAANFLASVLKSERILETYLRKGNSNSNEYEAEFIKVQEVLDYERARAEIYFPDHLADNFGLIITLLSVTRLNIFAVHNEIYLDKDSKQELISSIKRHLEVALPKQRKAVGKELKVLLLPDLTSE